jgi:general secretion pathway protein L
MARRVIGLDVGTYSVKVAHLESRSRGGEFEVAAYAEKMLHDIVVEGENEASVLLLRQEAAIKALKDEGLIDTNSIVAGLTGADAQVRSMLVPFSNAKKIEAVLGGMLDAQLPLAIDDLTLSWFLQPKKLTLKTEGKAAPSENQILVAFAKKESIAAYLELLKKAGVDPRFLTLKAASLFDILQYTLKRQGLSTQTVSTGDGQVLPSLFAMVDIGHKSTGVCVAEAGRLVLARSVLRGGYDVTAALATKLQISHDEAEKRKIEQAYIETETDKAKLLEQHLTSEALKEAYMPVVRELRQTLLALDAGARGQLSQVFLVGGGSRVKNLDRFLSSTLNVPVSCVTELGFAGGSSALGPQAALVSSYAIAGQATGKNAQRFNLRKDEFAWAGEYNFMRSRAKAIAIWVVVLLMSLLFQSTLRNWTIGKEAADLKKKELTACQAVIGKKVESGSRCLAMIKDQISGQGNLGIPEFSAADVYLEVARVMPPGVQIKVSDLDISDKTIRLSGETSGFEAVDQIVAGVSMGRCFTNVEKGRARQSQEKVQFQLSIDLDCAGPKAEETPKAKSKARGK